MSQYSGYITDINELYIFAHGVDNFCCAFRNGCKAVASAKDSDYSSGLQQLSRIRRWVSDLAQALAALKCEYSQYISQESYDSSRADMMLRRIREAEEELRRAQEELRLAEHIFDQFSHELELAADTALSYAGSIESLGNEAVRAIRWAADFINRTYNG